MLNVCSEVKLVVPCINAVARVRARARARVARGSTRAAYGRVHVRVRTVHECGRARASARVARGSTREACAFPNASALALH